MPNRIIRDGWLESESVNTLDAFAERFYLRLMLRADDFGRYHANPVLLKSNLFPLKEDVRSTDIPRWLAACEKAGLLRCYEADAKPYLEVVKFGQRIRDGATSKFPEPPLTCDGASRESAADSGGSRPSSETKSEANAESETKSVAGEPLRLAKEEIQMPETMMTEAFKAKWSEWLQYRRERRLPGYKPTGTKAQWNRLAAMGHDAAIAAIDHSMAQNYQGIFPAGLNGHGKPAAGAPPARPLMR